MCFTKTESVSNPKPISITVQVINLIPLLIPFNFGHNQFCGQIFARNYLSTIWKYLSFLKRFFRITIIQKLAARALKAWIPLLKPIFAVYARVPAVVKFQRVQMIPFSQLLRKVHPQKF